MLDSSALRRLGATSDRQRDIGLLVLRLWFGGVLAINHGWPKMADLGNFTAKVAKRGVPIPELMAPLAAASEFVGGLLLALGLLTRVASLPVACTMLVAAFHVHAADPFSKKEFALGYALAAVAIAIIGPGRLSLDQRLFGADDPSSSDSSPSAP
jgi:putative oxidoreductase